MNKTLLRGGAQALVRETSTQLGNCSSPRRLQICKDAQHAVGISRRPSRKEDHGRLQGGGGLEEWVSPDVRLDLGGTNCSGVGGGRVQIKEKRQRGE